MDGKGFSILGVGVLGAAAIMFYVSHSESNTAERAVITAKQERSIAEHDARMAREFGDLAAAKTHDSRAAEADAALAKAKSKQELKEAAAEVRNGQLVEAAAGDIGNPSKPAKASPSRTCASYSTNNQHTNHSTGDLHIMSRTKKQPTLDDLEAQIRALQAQRDDRKKALEAEEKKRKAAEAEKRKGDLQLVGNKIGAAAVKLGLADLIYDGKLPMAAVEAALKALLAVPVTPATLGPEVLVEVAAPVGMVEPEGVTG